MAGVLRTSRKRSSADQRSEATLQCTCGAEEDVPHTRGCPLFDSL
jgi:hypothetical protein